MKDFGIYEIYKNIDDYEWENLENKSDTYIKNKYYPRRKINHEIIFKEMVEIFKVEKPKFKIFFPHDYVPEIKTTGEDEKWKKIEGFNYSVSNYGMIKNNTSGKIKALRNGIYGYQVNLWNKSKGKMFTLSRTVANYFIREVKENERVRHIDGCIRNNYYKNLEIVSK